MQNSKMIRDYMTLITGYYGQYASKEIENDVFEWILTKVENNMDALGYLTMAIKENCGIRFGAPDVSDVTKAVDDYEKREHVRIRRRYEDTVASPWRTTIGGQPTEQDKRDRALIAEVMKRDGYDIKQEWSITAFIMSKVRREYDEKHDLGAFAKEGDKVIKQMEPKDHMRYGAPANVGRV